MGTNILQWRGIKATDYVSLRLFYGPFQINIPYQKFDNALGTRPKLARNMACTSQIRVILTGLTGKGHTCGCATPYYYRLFIENDVSVSVVVT